MAVAAGVAAGCGAVRLGLPGTGIAQLCAAIAAGAALGALMLRLVDAPFLRELRGLLRLDRGASAAPAT
jgi:peptidoglycan/LPS O-acetylase OafA/YrhL